MAELERQHDDVAAVRRLSDHVARVKEQLARVIVGQQAVTEQMLIALFAGGHCLLVGVPGLAKTLIVRTLADALSLSFSRIQFTPDLMPADITGTEVIHEKDTSGEQYFRFIRGPVFAHVVLADEINRTPPKTQAALLEAMQEHQVTVGGEQHPLMRPFFVLATQNPIEQEGTYPLPEAHRFMFQLQVDYPDEEEEFQIVRRTTSDSTHRAEPTLGSHEILELASTVRKVPVADHLIRDALRLVRMTRPGHHEAPDFVREYVQWGAGPRASQYLVLGAKARAALHGRYCVTGGDIGSLAAPVLRHRLIMNYQAEADAMDPEAVIEQLLDKARVPRESDQ